jgi:PAS domain S-box-containing protein
MDPIALTVLLIIADPADEAEIRQKLAGARKARFDVHTVPTFADAFEETATRSFDIFLADLAVPDSDGMSGLQHLISVAKDVPVVIISSVHDEAQALETVRAGADDYTVKNRMNPAAFERVLLYAAERHAARRHTTLQFAVSRALAESQTVAEASDGILRVLCESLKFDLGEIWQINPAANRLVHSRSWSASSRKYLQFQALSQTVQFRCGEGLPGRVWDTHAPEWIDDVTESASFTRAGAAISAGLRCGFAIPLGLFQKSFGVIAFFSHDRKAPDEELVRFLMSIANQMGQFMARKFAEEEHAKIGKELALILDSTSEGIYGVNLSGAISFINEAAARMFGCNREDVVGKDAHTLFHHTRPDGTPYPASECPLSRTLKSGKSFHNDVEYFWKADGSHFSVSYSAIPVIENARVSGAVVSFEDISEKRQMEVELRHAQKLEAVGGLAAGIAHEINTPIQFIGDNARFLQTSFVESMQMIAQYEQICEHAANGTLQPAMLQDVAAVREKIEWDFLSTEVPKAFDQVLDGVNRVATIVRAMKEFSHVDHSSEKAPADLNKAIESTLIVARNEVKYVADVQTEFGALPPVHCHLGDLNQVFLNLFINAAHAIGDVVKKSGEKGRITVRTWQDGDNVVVSIADTGTGIPERVRAKVFEPFFTTKEVGKGTGQGLALARAIVVDKHGGTLSFETKMGEGTTFFVRLPANSVPATREVVVT